MNNPSRSLRRAVVLAASAALTGCHHADSLIGQWSDSDPSKPGEKAQLVMEFKPNGTETQTIITPLVSISYQATYTAKAGLLTENRVSVTLNGHYSPLHGTNAYQYDVKSDTLNICGTHGEAPRILYRQDN